MSGDLTNPQPGQPPCLERIQGRWQAALVKDASGEPEGVGKRRGKPRLTPEEYQRRLVEYCARYGVAPAASGLAPFPAGRRETKQHREWIALYKAHQRLGRRERGECERCGAPVAADGAYCDVHRAAAG